MLLRLAWRNLWRNPRRSGLTLSAGAFGTFLVLIMLSLAAGSHQRWVDQATGLYPGHVEVMTADYREHRTLDYGLTLTPEQTAMLESLPGAEGWAPRLETWALAIPDRDQATGRATFVVGIDPPREQRLSRLAASIDTGAFLNGPAEPGAFPPTVLGKDLARHLGIGPGDAFILMSQDLYGSQSAARFQVAGTLSVGDARFDQNTVLVRLEDLQSFLEYPGGLTHVALFARDSQQTEALEATVETAFSRDSYDVLGWPKLLPDLLQMIILDKLGNYVMLVVLVVVIAFGMVNTVLMSVLERVREFGVMRALGVRSGQLFSSVLLESSLLSAVGIVVGLVLATPIILLLEGNPIPMTGDAVTAMETFGIEPLVVFKLQPVELIRVPVVLMIVSLLSSLLPAVRASRGRPVDGLREA